ncbi:MAG: InlB B-repeat-containing protein, partial [Clostridia bacterium]|nr:InlB B-repeat-containing protein [Clostridia bacterium]
MRKSKVMKALLTLGMSIATATSVAAIAACTHEHTSDGKWKNDKNQHWHEATCSDHPGEKYDIANHIDEEGNDGKCDVCEYVMVTPTVETWTVTLKDGDSTSTVKVEKGKKLTAAQIPAPTKDGYTFDGWFNGSTKLTTDTAIASDITY